MKHVEISLVLAFIVIIVLGFIESRRAGLLPSVLNISLHHRTN